MKHQAPFIDRVNDRIADAGVWVGPVLLVLGIAGMVASVLMYLWK
jgi:hypothetical protein